MIGAIAGDTIGSVYEFDSNNIKTTDFPLFRAGSAFTDDSIMTLAVAKALLESRGGTDEEIKTAVSAQMRAFGDAFPYAGYGGMFADWLYYKDMGPYNSFGNGSAMRVSAAGWVGTTMEEVLRLAELSACVTHNHPEGIKGAQATAAAIFMARKGESKDAVKNFIEDRFGYDLSATIDEIRPGYTMDETCQGTVPQAITAFLEGNGFEDVIRLAISIGGDSDTIGAIAGSIAEAAYGVPRDIRRKTEERLDNALLAVLRHFEALYPAKITECD